MRRYLLSILTLVGALGFGTSSWAQNAHFIRATSSLTNDGNLVCSWKEAGLGNNQLIQYTCSADATATYVCVNRGGGNPSAQNKTTVSGPVSESGEFSSGKNGQITQSLTVQPPPSDISCPPGQSLELASVSYDNVVLTDTTNGVSISLADQESGCLLPNVRGACD